MPDIDNIVSQLEKMCDEPDESVSERIARTTVEEARTLIKLWSELFRRLLITNGVDAR
ncbi:MAG: hypothetical protein KF770_02985 [Anaerolineae bacterium]|nr:hypothetical protein [Anaerolineae bacterium]